MLIEAYTLFLTLNCCTQLCLVEVLKCESNSELRPFQPETPQAQNSL